MASSSSPSRIALLTERYPPDIGGLAASVHRLATGLAARDEPVAVFTLTAGRPPGATEVTETDGVVLHRLGRGRKSEDAMADWLTYLTAEHRRLPFRVLHAYYVTRPGFMAVHAGRVLGVPSVVSARGNDLDRTVFDASKAAHTLHALQHADAITTNAHDLATKARALAPGRVVTVIPNGVDTQLFKPLERDAGLAASLGLGDGPVIGFVGEARAKKGLAHLLLAFAEVAGRQAAKLLLVGGVRKDDQPTLEVFRAQHPQLEISVVEDVPPAALPPYYALMDVFVMPSVRDGLPNAILEAMACGRAIVATDAGGMPDALRHGENGHVVQVGDIDGLARGIEHLLGAPELRARYGAAARDTVERDFTPRREVEMTLSLYEVFEDSSSA